MKQVIYISRPKEESKAFCSIISSQIEATIICHSQIRFEFVKARPLPLVDWVFFYSKKGVHFFCQQLPSEKRLANIKLAAMGTGTATELKQYKLSPSFVGSGHPAKTAQEFLQLAKGQKVAFVQSVHSRQSVQRLLYQEIDALDYIVYENILAPTTIFPTPDMITFTSPMNVKAFLQSNTIQKHQIIVAIGKTTKKALEKRQLTNVHVPEKPSQEALAELVLSLIPNRSI